MKIQIDRARVRRCIQENIERIMDEFDMTESEAKELMDNTKVSDRLKVTDFKWTLLDVHPNGFPFNVSVHIGEWDTRQCIQMFYQIYDDKGERLYPKHSGERLSLLAEYETERKKDFICEYEDPEDVNMDEFDPDYPKYPMKSLQDELEVLGILAEHLGTEQQCMELRYFRYAWRGLLDRFPRNDSKDAPRLYVEEAIPEDYWSWDDKIDDFSKKWKEFQALARNLDKNHKPPVGCPPLRVRLEWNKPIWMIAQRYIDQKFELDWIDGNHQNIYKFLSLKFIFKGKYKSPKAIESAYTDHTTKVR
tara:strand:+ start:296 stop:1210 length:915 start_codon:yes stop_codon:yes gene_type:complete